MNIQFFMENDSAVQNTQHYKVWKNDDETSALCLNTFDNTDNMTSKEFQNRLIELYDGEVTYSPVNDGWFALSINDATFYHYAYYIVENDCVRGFEFHFTGNENLTVYSKYIDYIYESFRTF